MPTEPIHQHAAALRRRAEAQVAAMEYREDAALSPDEARRLLHELRVHQIELEMQRDELIRTQVELEASRARYFDLYHLAPVGYLTVSEKGTILEANLRAAALLGLPSATLVKRTLSRFVLPADSHVYYHHLRQLFGTGMPQACEVRLAPPGANSPIRGVRLEMALARDEKEQATVSRVICLDISERKAAVEALAASEERYRDLYENAPLAHFSVGPDARIRRCNRQASQLLGYTVGQLVGRPVFDLYADTPHGKAKARQVFQRFLAAEPVAGEELQMVKADGTLVWISLSVTAIRDATGQVIESRSSVTDISARKQAEEALRESEERYRMLMMLSPDGISVADQTGRILACNEQFARMHGFDRSAEVVGRYGQELSPPEAFARFQREVAASLNRGESIVRNIEIEVLRRDGSSFLTEYSVSRVPWPDAPFGAAYISHIRDVTGRKMLEAELDRHRIHLEELVGERSAALLRSERILAEAERIGLVGSWESDLISGDLHISDGLYRILGFDPEMTPQAVHDAAWKQVHPDDAAAARAEIGRAQATGTPVDVTFRFIQPSGETMVLRLMAEFESDAAGRPVLMWGAARDITAPEQARTALRRRVAELTRLQELSHPVSLDLSLGEFASGYLDRIIEYAEVDLAQVSLLRDGELRVAAIRTGPDLTVADMPTPVVGECLCGRAVRDGEPQIAAEVEEDARCILCYCRANGLHSVAALPLKTGDAAIGVLTLGATTPGAFVDKREFLDVVADLMAIRLHNATLHQEIRQRADGLEESVAERTRELQAERDRTHAILETVGESVVVTDLEGEVLFANPATTDLTGFSRDELLGQRLWHSWTTQTLADAWPGAQQTLAAGQAWQGEVFGRRKDGALYVARLTGSPLRDAGAPRLPVGAVWVQRDVTDLKQAERLKDQFVSNVSHELRTPISIIGLSCDNLDIYRDRLNEDQRWQLVRDIHDQAHLLNRLVEDIMVLSRIDVGRVSEEHTQVDLAGLLAEEVDRQQVFAKERYQDLASGASHPILVQGNALQLRQVVRNLLDNAIKYTPQGGRVRCTCEVRTASPAEAAGGAPSSAPRSWAVIEVADNGIGIAPEAVPVIFERFYRGQVEGEVPGTGLGLSIARELAQLHGGWIDVASEPGVGSTFTVYLPWPGDELEGLGSAFRGG